MVGLFWFVGQVLVAAGKPLRFADRYRRIRIFLEREGHAMSRGRCYRLWRDAHLQVPHRRPRKRIATGRPRPQAPSVAPITKVPL